MEVTSTPMHRETQDDGSVIEVGILMINGDIESMYWHRTYQDGFHATGMGFGTARDAYDAGVAYAG